MASHLTTDDFEIDERAAALLAKIPEEQQQVALHKLQTGIAGGKVRNQSSYIVGVLNGPDVLGIDDEATKLLRELPKEQQKQVLDNFRQTADVRNPSAWIAKAVIKAKKEGGGGCHYQGGGYQHQAGGYQHQPAFRQQAAFGGGGGHAMGGAIDANALNLLQTLPPRTQQEILGKLQEQGGSVRNVSAWVVKAALQAGAVSTQEPMAHVQQHHGQVHRNPYAQAAGGSCPQLPMVDADAMNLLSSLPRHMQQEISGKFQNALASGELKNASAWVAKAALKAGANTPAYSARAGPGIPVFPVIAHGKAQAPQQQRRPQAPIDESASMSMLVSQIDEKALELLQSLAPEQQQEIAAKFEKASATGSINNPSAWMVKAALNAKSSFGPVRSQQGQMRASPW